MQHVTRGLTLSRRILGKRPYMYAVIAESEDGSYPLAHLLAESHTVPTIMHILTQLRRDFKLVTKIPFSPPRIVTDFSWAMLHAASEGLVKTSLHAYLKACWETTTADSSPPDTLISLCGAHISHRLSHDIKGKGVKKDAAGGFMWLFARMQKASSLATLDQHFGTFCVLALSKQQPSLQVECLMPKEPSDAQMLIDDTETAAAGTYRTQSAFGRHFDRVAKNAQEVVEAAPCVTSVFYCPSLVQYMLTTIMPLAPLWSQLITKTVASNAAVEAHMRVVKRQLLQGRTRPTGRSQLCEQK